MDAQELVRRVQRFGLDAGEAHLYLHLCRIGPSRAVEVARAAGRKRTDVYRILDRLVAKGFCEKSLQRPARFIPHPPEDALRRATEARRRDLDMLDQERDALAAAWPMAVPEAGTPSQRFAVIQGRARIDGLLARLIDGAHDEILLATSSDALAHLDARALFAALARRADDGVSVRVLARHSDLEDRRVRAAPGVRLRWGAVPTFYHVLIVDERDTALFVSSGKNVSREEETILWLSSSDVVLSQKALFDLAWNQGYAGRPVDGRPPPHMQVVRGRWVRDAHLKDMLQDARSSIELVADPDEARRLADAGVASILAGKVQEGIDVRLSATGLAVPGARRAAGVGPAEGVIAIVDDRESLVGLAGDGDWAIHATLPALATIQRALVRQVATHDS